MTLRIAVTARAFRDVPGPHHELLERKGLTARFPEHDASPTEDELVSIVKGCAGLIAGTEPITERVLRTESLRAVVRFGTGMDNVDQEAAKRHGVAVTSTPGANARSVAELTIALMLGLARHVVSHDRSMRSGTGGRRVGVEMAGRRLGVVGYGAVGKEVARLGRCLGMDVVAHDPFETATDVAMVSLTELLRTCDVVSLHVPLTERTRAMIDAAALDLMPPNAFLINTARGGIVDERALERTLVEGRLAGAALDCFAEEPATESPLLKLDNFIASPHAGAFTREAALRTGVAAVEAIARLLDVDGDAR